MKTDYHIISSIIHPFTLGIPGEWVKRAQMHPLFCILKFLGAVHAGVGYSLMQRVRKLIDNLKSFLSRIRDIETLKEKETFKAKVELVVVYY